MCVTKDIHYEDFDEEKVDWLCSSSPWWDRRFHGCPLREDSSVRKCRFVLTLTNLQPRYCMIMRHSGAVTLREVGEHLSN